MTLFIFLFFNLLNPTLSVSFTNLKEAKGSLYVGIYKSETDFLKEEKVCFRKIISVKTTGNLDLALADLAAGTYAISCFHDLNDNGKLDTNFFGIPTEPYGFSNNARPTFRAPKWSEAKFELKDDGAKISIKLEKW